MAQAQNAGAALVRANKGADLWTAPAQPVQYGREDFRFRVMRTARRLPTIDLDPWTETAEWERANGVLSGTLTFRRPSGSDGAVMVASGDTVVCEWAQFGGSGPWRRLWQMKTGWPSQQVLDGIITLALSSITDGLPKSKVAWKIRTDSQHPHGWTADQITRHVCGRFRIPIVSMPKGTHRISKYVQKSASPTDVITWAWTQERTNTGRRFDVDFSTGAVKVTELAEPRYVLQMGASMLDATVTQQLTGIASAVIATAARKNAGSKTTQKLTVQVVDAARRNRYGYIAKTLNAPAGINSVAELRAWAKKQLATLYASEKTITFTHPGVPLVDVGTPLELYLPEADLSQTVFVTDARHDLSAGNYQMQVSIAFDDPFAQANAVKLQKKASVTKARGRTTTTKAPAPPKPKKAAMRSNG